VYAGLKKLSVYICDIVLLHLNIDFKSRNIKIWFPGLIAILWHRCMQAADICAKLKKQIILSPDFLTIL